MIFGVPAYRAAQTMKDTTRETISLTTLYNPYRTPIEGQ